MFQDIQPHVLKNQNDQQRAPRSGDYILIGRQQQVLLMNGTLPKYEDIDADYAFSPDQYQYLLAVDQAAFFWVDVDAVANDNYTVGTTRGFRDLTPAWLAFSSATVHKESVKCPRRPRSAPLQVCRSRKAMQASVHPYRPL